MGSIDVNELVDALGGIPQPEIHAYRDTLLFHSLPVGTSPLQMH